MRRRAGPSLPAKVFSLGMNKTVSKCGEGGSILKWRESKGRRRNNYIKRYITPSPHLTSHTHTATRLPAYLPYPSPHPRFTCPLKIALPLQNQSPRLSTDTAKTRNRGASAQALHTSAYRVCRACKAMDVMTIIRGRSFCWMTWFERLVNSNGAEKRGLDAWLCGGARAGLKRNGAKGVASAAAWGR